MWIIDEEWIGTATDCKYKEPPRHFRTWGGVIWWLFHHRWFFATGSKRRFIIYKGNLKVERHWS